MYNIVSIHILSERGLAEERICKSCQTLLACFNPHFVGEGFSSKLSTGTLQYKRVSIHILSESGLAEKLMFFNSRARWLVSIHILSESGLAGNLGFICHKRHTKVSIHILSERGLAGRFRIADFGLRND
jgi:hypothetical protein